MSLFDFFFPEQAQAVHLRTIAERGSSSSRRRKSSDSRKLKKRVEDLEDDVGYIALVLGALLHKLDEKGHVTRDEAREVIAELDGLDGVQDGKLDVSILKGISI